MTRVLKTYVHVDGQRFAKGMSADDVGDAASRIGDHAWVGEDGSAGTDAGAPPSPPASGPSAPDESTGAEPETGEAEGSAPAPVDRASSGSTPAPPAKAGPGSSAEAWRDYAKGVGVEVPGDAKRDDVIEAIRAAGKPVD